ncbi:Phospholipid metabolism protein [Linderina pennispora]|nr:Phospholipid metabolism protein [Linderina pennispora]
MRLFEATHVFKHDWDTVSLANWRKYPNDKTPHVRHVEVINQELDETTGILRMERLIMVKQNVPTLIRKLFGGDVSYVLEYSEVDPKQRTLTMQSQNLTFGNLLSVGEHIVYKPDPENVKHTVFVQSAQVKAAGAMSRFASRVEDFCVNRFKDNASIGRMGLEQVVSTILAERKQAQTMLLAA